MEASLAEVVASLSLAADLGAGQPFEHGLRTCVLATRLAEAAGLAEEERRDVYYVALLRSIGCTSDAMSSPSSSATSWRRARS